MSASMRIDMLREQGADRFDRVDFAFIESLQRRMDTASVGVQKKLKARLARHLFSLELRFQSSRDEVRKEIEALSLLAPDAANAARALFDSGELARAMGAVSHARHRLASPAWGRAKDRLERTLSVVENRCQFLPPEAEKAHALLQNPDIAGDAARRAQRLANALVLILLQERAELSCAQLEVDHLKRSSSEDAGPYNADALAATALDQLSALSPRYLRAYLSYLGDLECLEHLPQSPAETAKPTKAPRATRATTKSAARGNRTRGRGRR